MKTCHAIIETMLVFYTMCLSQRIGGQELQKAYQPQWLSLPSTSSLPNTAHSGLAEINGIRIWYVVFGRGEPVVLLHGGLANANYWGDARAGVGQAAPGNRYG